MKIGSVFYRTLIPGDLKISRKSRYATTSNSALFLDLDGTLWPDLGPGSILRKVQIPDYVALLLQEISHSGILLIAFTNQTLFGYEKKLNLRNIMRYRFEMSKLVRRGAFDSIYICHHHPNSKIAHLRKSCSCRKPQSGLVDWAIKDFFVDKEHSYAIGDRITDIVAAQNSGVRNCFLIANDASLQWNISVSQDDYPVISFTVLKNLREGLIHLLKDRLNEC